MSLFLKQLGQTIGSWNWRRGVFRAWVGLSVLWVASVIGTVVLSNLLGSHQPPAFVDDFVLDTPANLARLSGQQAAQWWGGLAAALALLFGPPIGLYLIGRGVAWVGLGFAPSRKG